MPGSCKAFSPGTASINNWIRNISPSILPTKKKSSHFGKCIIVISGIVKDETRALRYVTALADKHAKLIKVIILAPTGSGTPKSSEVNVKTKSVKKKPLHCWTFDTHDASVNNRVTGAEAVASSARALAFGENIFILRFPSVSERFRFRFVGVSDCHSFNFYDWKIMIRIIALVPWHLGGFFASSCLAACGDWTGCTCPAPEWFVGREMSETLLSS